MGDREESAEAAMRSADQPPHAAADQYRLLVEELLGYAIVLLEPRGRVLGWNAGAERIFGWRADEAAGLPFDFIFTPEDRAEGAPAHEIENARLSGRSLDLRWHLRRDGTRFWGDGVLERLTDASGEVRGFAKILRDATEQKRAEEALQAAHRRTTNVLESITDAFYALDRNFNLTYVNRRAEEWWGVPREELLGTHIWSRFPEAVGSPVYDKHLRAIEENAPVHFETVSPVLNRWIEGTIHPAADGGVTVYFRDISDRKALEQSRAALAARERNIAEQLQEALQPDLPGKTPGLAVTKYYEAALSDEANVGGDFFDVFAVDKGCTALVVGDLAGKGLVAAAQVSTVRNMLRAFVYSKPSLSEAVNELNRVLAENSLLVGFATLLVATYDSGTGKLAYVNCGQEPALVRRKSSASVEMLLPTGPILGAIESVRYEVGVAWLGGGDAVAVFTDGLTEVGPRRNSMIGIEGVAELLASPVEIGRDGDACDMAEAYALRLLKGVDEAVCGSHTRDDMCLLVAVVAPAE